jgi:hypothetical protein
VNEFTTTTRFITTAWRLYFVGNDSWEHTIERLTGKMAGLPRNSSDWPRPILQRIFGTGKLKSWIGKYNIPAKNNAPKNVGIVMAGNLPLVGFHDFLCVFLSGHGKRLNPPRKMRS